MPSLFEEQTQWTISETWGGGCKQGELSAAPAKLVKIFGPPNKKGDDYKVDREWTFENENGEIVTLYCYKATSMYHPSNPTPNRFWKSNEQQDFSVGGHNEVAANSFIIMAEELLKNTPNVEAVQELSREDMIDDLARDMNELLSHDEGGIVNSIVIKGFKGFENMTDEELQKICDDGIQACLGYLEE